MVGYKECVSRSDCSEVEWQTRIDLAVCYRLCEELKLNEGVCNHLTCLIPGTNLFLCTAYGILWSDVSAVNLLTVDMEGNVVRGEGTIETTAFSIHSRIHMKRPVEAAVVLHTHMPWATSICCLEDPTLLMIHQNSLRFWNDVVYDHTYNGLVLGNEEGDRLARVMGDKKLVMHSNHGVIIAGRSVASAFDDLYYLERACEVQVKALSMNKPVKMIDDKTAKIFKEDLVKGGEEWAVAHFEARKQKIIREADGGFS